MYLKEAFEKARELGLTKLHNKAFKVTYCIEYMKEGCDTFDGWLSYREMATGDDESSTTLVDCDDRWEVEGIMDESKELKVLRARVKILEEDNMELKNYYTWNSLIHTVAIVDYKKMTDEEKEKLAEDGKEIAAKKLARELIDRNFVQFDHGYSYKSKSYQTKIIAALKVK